MPPDSVCRVVSSPPMSNNNTSVTISWSASFSPSTSACTSTLTKSSVGSALRAAIMLVMYSV